MIAETNPTAGDRYKFTGRELDVETGLYYYRARYYDPGIGRFISEDPIAFAGGDANLYRYVANSPLTATDPSGNVALVEYGKKLWAGPVGAVIRTAQFRCFAWQLGGWGVSKLVFGDLTYTHRDNASLALAGISCTAFPTSAKAQAVFLALTETLYLYTTNASATDVGITGLMHAIGISGGAGLSRHVGRVWGKIDPNNRIGRAVGKFSVDEGGWVGLRKAINLPSAKKIKIDMDHIASGHMKGGSRVSPRKDLFPESWSRSQVEGAVKAAYKTAKKVGTQGDRVLVQGQYGGKTIEMWVNTVTKTIETAYPKGW